MKLNFIYFIGQILLISVFTLSALGQSGEVSGTIVDQNDAAISGASVVLKNKETGLERTTTTNNSGEFVFNSISQGEYEIIAVAGGFKRAMAEAKPGSNQKITLEIAALTAETTIFSGSRQEELRESLNTKVEVITRKEIENTGYESVGEILREIPGIVTRRGSETGTSSGAAGEQIQGIGSRQALVLLDGFPVIGARGIKGGVINLDKQSTARLEQVEVVKGASSALYGSDAIGGVVNLITRESRKPLEGSVTISGGNFGIFDPRADLGFKKDKFSGFTSFERHKNNGFDLTPTTFDTTGAGFHRYDLFNKLKYEFTPSFYISSFADVHKGNIKGRSLGERGFQTENVDETTQSYGVTANWAFDPHAVAEVRGYFSRYDEIVEQKLISGLRVPDENLFQRYGKLDATLSYIWGERQFLQVGGEWTTDRYRGINRLRNDSGERADTRVLWGQDKINLAKWATLTLGLRYDNHSIFGSAVSPKVGLNIRASDRINLRASWGRGFRAPDLGQLYFRFFNPTNLYQVIGNPNLRPEHSGSWQAGMEYASRQKNYRFGVNFFRNDVVNLIESRNYGFVRTQGQLSGIFATEGIDIGEFRPVLNRLLFVYKNLANVYTQGAEADSEIILPKGFAVSGAYTYLDARDKDTGAYLSERSKHQAFLKFAYDNSKLGFRANIRGSYLSKWKTSTLTNRGLRQEAIAPGFTLWDIYGAKTIKNKFELFATVENLFNNKDKNAGKLDPITNTQLPIFRFDAGRTFRAGIRVSLSKDK